MSIITFKGQEIQTIGTLPTIGSKAKDFSLTNSGLEILNLSTFEGKRKILNIFPSIDTSVCAISVKTFEDKLLENTVILNISRDTPFAHGRFCQTEKITKAIPLADLSHKFGDDYELTMTSGPLIHLLSRAVIVLDIDNTVLYTEQVQEITNEPNYEAAITVLKIAP